MELTQIKWDKLWSKLKLEWAKSVLLPMPLGEKQDGNKEQWKIETDSWKKILTPHEDVHTEVNEEKVSDPVELKHWDTIWIWEDKSVLFAAHKPWEELSSEGIDEHFEKSWETISSEEMFELIGKIKQRQGLIVNSAIAVVFIIVFIFSWSVFYIYKNWSSNIIKEINNKLYPVEAQIQDLNNLIWAKDEDCDSDISDCWPDPDSVVWRIESLEKKWWKIENDIAWIKAYQESLNIVKDKVTQLDKTVSSWEIQPEIKEKIDWMIKGFVENFQNQQNLNEKIDNLSQELKKIDELAAQVKDIKTSMESVETIDLWENWENVWNAVKILLNKILELQNEIKDLKK